MDTPLTQLPRILLVDDDQNILNSLRRALRREGYEIIVAGSGAEALRLLQDVARSPEVIVCDFQMPDMNGVEVLKGAQTLCPDSVRIVLSGYADADMIQSLVNEGQLFRFLTKPWDDEELRAILRAAVARSETIRSTRSLLNLVGALQREAASVDLELAPSGSPTASGEAGDGDGCQPPPTSSQASIWEEIVELVPVAVVGVDMEGLVVLANPCAERLLGLDHWVLLGEPLASALPEQIVQLAEPVVRTGVSSPASTVVDGKRRLRVECVPLASTPRCERRGALIFVSQVGKEDLSERGDDIA